jgi:hypothetical protein
VTIRIHPPAPTADRAQIKRGRPEFCVAFQGGCVIPFILSYFKYSSSYNYLFLKHLMENFTCQALLI